MADLEPVPLSLLRYAERAIFRICAEAAEEMATKVESGELPMDAPMALRLLASMFHRSEGKQE